MLGALMFLAACSSSGMTGPMYSWIKGKSFSVQAINSSGGSPNAVWTLNLRNETNQELPITPVKLTAWFRQGGQKEATLSRSNMSGTGNVRPHETVMLAPELFKFSVAQTDQLDKLRIVVGPDNDTFTISR